MKNPTLSYLTRGSPDREAIVFLHPFPLSASFWDEGLRRLSETHYCVAPNLPGFGQSNGTPGALYFENMVDAFLGFLEERGLERSIWCGLSMGGYVALRAMEKLPQRCAKLILADTQAAADSDADRLRRAAGLADLREQGLEAFLTKQAPKLLGPSGHADAASLKRFLELGRESAAEGVAAGLVALATRTNTLEGLGQIKVPTLIVVGEEDAVTPLAAAEKLKAGISGSRLAVLPKAGHLSALTQPEAFYNEVRTFLKGS